MPRRSADSACPCQPNHPQLRLHLLPRVLRGVLRDGPRRGEPPQRLQDPVGRDGAEAGGGHAPQAAAPAPLPALGPQDRLVAPPGDGDLVEAGEEVAPRERLGLAAGLHQQALPRHGHLHPPAVAQPHRQPREPGTAVHGEEVQVVVEAGEDRPRVRPPVLLGVVVVGEAGAGGRQQVRPPGRPRGEGVRGQAQAPRG
eukprot:CAMPEP_0194734212 /NCGR_PEP_ID=MMETSP0296-20130528/68657_2 /TAXON_ID=39354 /ORGANISM="Heterosigma akashiwo, Strain CCMP2393" /LENGTH=197 /DNA_ID=CAMNT_0039642911 /DNA_START=1 /DNA_END=591 /DNA_ORIENTATION=-